MIKLLENEGMKELVVQTTQEIQDFRPFHNNCIKILSDHL